MENKIEKKLLVLVDGSERSIHTVNYVKDFMPIDDHTKIVLLHVFDSRPEWYQEAYQEAYQEVYQEIYQGSKDRSDSDGTDDALSRWEIQEQTKITAQLEQARQILIKGGFPESHVQIKCLPLEKGVALDIIHEAKKGYTAVIMRRRGMGKFKSIILGSVAVKLLQALTFIPIIIVGKIPGVKKILLAVDTSSSSMKAVDLIAQWLGGHGHEVCIFHAVPGLGGIHFESFGVDQSQFSQAVVSDKYVQAFGLKMTKLFQSIRQRLGASGFTSENISANILTGVHSRPQAIIEEADENGCGTIVVGRRGLSKVEAFFIGRVGYHVVYGATDFTVWVV